MLGIIASLPRPDAPHHRSFQALRPSHVGNTANDIADNASTDGSLIGWVDDLRCLESLDVVQWKCRKNSFQLPTFILPPIEVF